MRCRQHVRAFHRLQDRGRLRLAAKAARPKVILLTALLRLVVAFQLGAVGDAVAQAATVHAALQR